MPTALQVPFEPRWLPRGTRTFRARGAAALARISVDARVSADPPEAFRIDVLRNDLGEVLVERIRATPFRLEGPTTERDGAPSVSVCFVGHGTIEFEGPAAAAVSEHGFWAATERSVIAFSATQPVEVLRVAAPARRFAAEVLDALRLPRLADRRTPISDALFGLLRGLVDHPAGQPDDDPAASAHLARALGELVTAVVDALTGVEVASPDSTDRRRALEYIEQHLADPATSPDTIAAALGIGRRRLYRLFEDDEASIAGRIRSRRLEGVAALVESSATTPSLHGLATRFGFSSIDALTRNFRDRYGMSIRSYHRGTHATP